MTSQTHEEYITKELSVFKNIVTDTDVIKTEGSQVDNISYIDFNDLPRQLYSNRDNRGILFEIVKEMSGGQTFFSVTRPDVIRGNHFHTRKIERFCVVSGNAIIRLRRIGYNKIIEYKVTGNDPTAIDIPIYHTHNIENIGKSDLLTLFWSNDIFNPEAPDTYIEKV